MIYIIDTNIIKKLLWHFPKKGQIFETIWARIESKIQLNEYISVDECYNELAKQFSDKSEEYVWIHNHKKMFKNPTDQESIIIRQIFLKPKMRESIHRKNILENRPSADVYLVAKAKTTGGTIVTSENYKPNSAQLPNLCKELEVACMSYDDFMEIVSS